MSSIGLRASSRASVFRSGILFPLFDPMIGADGVGGSIWSRLVTRLLDDEPDAEFVLANVSRCGSTVEGWGRSGTFCLEETCADLAESGIRPAQVLWQQGESDTARGTSRNEYVAGVMALRDRLRRSGVDAPIFLALSTRWRGQVSQEIRGAIQDLVTMRTDFRLGPDTDALGDDYRSDGTHLSAEGQDAAAALWQEALAPGPR
ncbi:MAG: hypothetical protein JNL04_17160 [Rhodospirillaceae bacterium]|nr:hypothetical protein [Rhodospirillaceae bacterium]